MSFQFEYNNEKAQINLIKHGVTFQEAETIFTDPFSITINDDLHSQEKFRLNLKGEFMNNDIETNENLAFDDDLDMRSEYDFSKGIRGKHYLPNIDKSNHPVIIKLQNETGEKYITQKILDVQANISPDGILTATVPKDIFPGEYRVVLRIEQPIAF